MMLFIGAGRDYEPDAAGAGVMTARTWLHAHQLRADQEEKLVMKI
jgi:hypothetical protein